MIKHSQELFIGPDRVTCAELGVRSYEKMVAGLGGYGELVTKDEQIIPALQRAFASGKPACINDSCRPSWRKEMPPSFLSRSHMVDILDRVSLYLFQVRANFTA